MNTTPKMVSEPKTSITIATGVGLPLWASLARIKSNAFVQTMPSPPNTIVIIASASAHAAPVTLGAGAGGAGNVSDLSNKFVPHCLQNRKPWLYGAAQFGQYMKPP